MENSATHYHNQQKSAVKTRPTGRILMNGRQWVKGIQAVLCGKSGIHMHNVWPNDHGLLKIQKIFRGPLNQNRGQPSPWTPHISARIHDALIFF